MDPSGTRPLAFLAILVAVLVFPAESASSDYSSRAEVVGYVDGLVAEHAFGREWLLDVFEGAEKSDEVIRKISKPAEKALAWHEYREIFLTQARIDAGVEFWRTHQDALDAARHRFGVASEMITAIIGVETFYGRYLGSHRVIDSLATLAFEGAFRPLPY